MTNSQLRSIEELRQHNYSYRFIGEKLAMPMNTVKSICRRKGFKADGPRKTKTEKATALLCKNCHRPLPEGTRQGAVFCSDSCRIEWWTNNRKVIEK